MKHLNSLTNSIAAEQKRPSGPIAQPVSESLDRLEKQVVALRDILDRVFFRLEPVLTPAAPTPVSTGSEESQPLTAPLVSKVDTLTHFLRSACFDLQEIERRLAL